MIHDPLRPFLYTFGVIVLDGGLATELERRGADLRDELWSAKTLIEAPDLIRQVHLDYFLAGADVATTASYQATVTGFMRRGISAKRGRAPLFPTLLSAEQAPLREIKVPVPFSPARHQAEELMRLSVRLAQEAREQFWSDPGNRTGRLRPLVAASLGCYGAYLADGSEYRGDYGLNIEQLVEFHRPRIDILAAAQPDLLAFETVPCRIEAEAIVEVLGGYPDVPAWVSFSCRDEQCVWHGERLAECVSLVEGSQQVVAVGINCTAPKHIDGLLASLAGKTSKPILVYPNSGEGWDAERKVWLTSPQDMDWHAAASRWLQAGAAAVGGCCRTTPDTIKAIANLRP